MFAVTFDAPSLKSNRCPPNEGHCACQFCGATIHGGEDVSWEYEDTLLQLAIYRSDAIDRVLALNMPPNVLRTIFEFSQQYWTRDSRAKVQMDWCATCHRLSGECCRENENGCVFDEYWTKAPISYTLDGIKHNGSIVVPPHRLNEFVEYVRQKRLTIETFCACPGNCPQYSLNHVPKDECCRPPNKWKERKWPMAEELTFAVSNR